MKTTTKTALAFLCAATIASCQKEVPLLSAKDNLSHSWKLQQQGTDLNKNFKFDTEEKNEVADSAEFTYQFKNNGTGFRVGHNNNYVDTLTWELYNSDRSIKISINSKGFINNLLYKYDYGTQTLILEDTTVDPSFFRLFGKED